jgi:murein DD-endopeptidase MepM/ murein hydrolase activator NlpD
MQNSKAQLEEPRFLITPYYGQKSVYSWFDHRLPNGTHEQHIVTFFGDERDNPDPNNCTFGWNGNCYDGHNGYDFDLHYDQVLASAAGTVSQAGWYANCHNGENCGYGLYVELFHSIDGVNYITRYGHLTTITVAQGQSIRTGQILGTSSSTGASTGPHLHFEVRVLINGQYRVVDPFGWQPIEGADVTVDPWPQSQSGATSWCMWIDGEWANQCDPGYPSRPLPRPVNSSVIIKNDTQDNTNGFSKGYGGLFLHPCSGTGTGCPSWWNVGAGQGGHAYRSIADGNMLIDHWAKWQTQELPAYSAPYEVFVWIPSMPGYDSDTFTWQAKYYIVDGQGNTFTTIIDEYIGDGQNYDPHDTWLSIGVYYITSNSYVYTTDATGEAFNTHCPDSPDDWCRMAVDAIKLVRLGTTYIPSIDPLNCGWSTPIIMSNSGGGTSREKWSFFNQGNYCFGDWWPTIPPLGQISKNPGCTSVDSAIVDSDQDVMMVNVHRFTSPVKAHSYTGIGVSGSNNPFRASTINYLPILYSHDVALLFHDNCTQSE